MWLLVRVPEFGLLGLFVITGLVVPPTLTTDDSQIPNTMGADDGSNTEDGGLITGTLPDISDTQTDAGMPAGSLPDAPRLEIPSSDNLVANSIHGSDDTQPESDDDSGVGDGTPDISDIDTSTTATGNSRPILNRHSPFRSAEIDEEHREEHVVPELQSHELLNEIPDENNGNQEGSEIRIGHDVTTRTTDITGDKRRNRQPTENDEAGDGKFPGPKLPPNIGMIETLTTALPPRKRKTKDSVPGSQEKKNIETNKDSTSFSDGGFPRNFEARTTNTPKPRTKPTILNTNNRIPKRDLPSGLNPSISGGKGLKDSPPNDSGNFLSMSNRGLPNTNQVMKPETMNQMNNRVVDSNHMQNIKRRLGNMEKRYPPPHKMFKNTSEFLNALPQRKNHLLQKLQRCKVQGEPAFNFSRVSENDAKRILDELQGIPDGITDKMVEEGGLKSLSVDEISRMPVSVFPTLTEKKVTELRLLPKTELDSLCDKLTRSGACPWNLWLVFESGMNCIGSSVGSKKRIQNKKGIGYSASKVMMTYARETSLPSLWNATTFIEMSQSFKDSMTAADIESIPENVVRESVRNISTIKFPYKSQFRAVIDRASAVFKTPTAWPESFISDMGPLLNRLDADKVALIRNNALYDIAEDLDKFGVTKKLTRKIMAKGIHETFKLKANNNDVGRVLPWLKEERDFTKALDVDTTLATFISTDFSPLHFTEEQKFIFAEKVENYLMGSDFGNETGDYIQAFNGILDGFTKDYLQWIPDDLVANMTRKKPVRQPSKAKILLKKLKRSLGKERLTAREAVMLFSGLDLADIEHMSEDDLIDVLPELRDMDLPFHIARKVVKKIERPLLRKNVSYCNTAFRQLGKLSKFVSPHVLDDENYVPVNNIEEWTEDCQQTDIKLRKSQAYVVMENTMEHTRNVSETDLLNARTLRQLGRFVIGLSVKDIETLPLDTELLSIIEVLSDFEDDLSSSQTDAIVEKIRQYLDISNRNQITEASDITVAQIGRFLQYLKTEDRLAKIPPDDETMAPEFELPKFPNPLRPSISRELGKSSLLKVSSGQRQALFSFALKSVDGGEGSTVDVLQRGTVNNNDIEDLGSLKCGLTVDIVNKLSQDAMDKNMEDFQSCPLKDDVFEALGKRAVDLNVNRVKVREGLGPMASTLQYLSDNDASYINQKELSSMTSFILTSMDQLDSTFEQSEKNGFVAERNARAKEDNKARRKKFVKKIHDAMVQSRREERCPVFLALGSALSDSTSLSFDGNEKCLEVVGTLPNWDKADARELITKVLSKERTQLDKSTLSSMGSDMIRQTAGWLKGLTDEQMKLVNITNIETLAAIGSQDFSHSQLQIGFETWNFNQYKTINLPFTDDELASMQNFACALSVPVMQDRLQVGSVLNNLDSLSQLKCFNPEQMKVLVDRVKMMMPTKPLPKWRNYLINEMGRLIAGFSKNLFQQLTKEQIEVIEPEIISSLPPEKVQEFTVEQLEQFSTNQVAAVTSMQRSYMSEDQIAAIGKGFLNGAGQNSFGNSTLFVILLSLLRQIVVYL